jgi:hypothetical protein
MTDTDRRRTKEHAVTAINAVESILRRWDPIGVAPGEFAPADEYDSYAPHIVSMLAGASSVVELADHLEHIRTVSIGLPADRDRDMACATQLVDWWRSREQRA